MTPPLVVVDLGRRGYAPVLELQRALCKARVEGALTDDLLLLVEHDPVMTLGRSTKGSSLPIPPAELTSHGVEVFEIERGGDVTFHGPGQLVGYPIVDLQQLKPDLHWYLRELEGALIDALATLGIPGQRSPGQTGVWVGPRKIASIGVHVKKWVTLHGFALNVTTDLKYFDLIVPCGIEGVEMTSVERETTRRRDGETASVWEVMMEAVVASLAHRFARDPRRLAPSDLAGNLPELAGVLRA
ncbi:MAG TPA: lipoyl(octanoyl) transferase LipB [Gemmatimonadales bacterium]|nr:lipoyl(octanoyl) transferase LipB [Gemmatimonadales bacterium]